jgi:acetyl esterase
MPLDPQAKALLDFLGFTTQPGIETLTPQAARDRFRALTDARKQMGANEPVHQVRDIRIPGPSGEIPVRMYTPDVQKPAPVLIYFHGGGWVLGDLDSHDHVCRAMANAVPCVVASVDYRLAPETKFPAAVEDSYAALEWIAANAGELGIDSGRIAVGGDSAGGNLAAVICQMARDRKGPKPVYQVLIYPATDMRMVAPSMEENSEGPLLTKAAMAWFIDHYLRGEKDKLDPLASPLLAADLTGLPAAFILTAECDPLRDEGEDYGQKLKSAGVPVEVKRYAGMPHGFFSFGAALTTAQESMADTTTRLSKAFQAESVKAESAA